MNAGNSARDYFYTHECVFDVAGILMVLWDGDASRSLDVRGRQDVYPTRIIPRPVQGRIFC
ncbi:MAG: hypothetical protein HXY43_23255 [Fischerella sp.]|uniref:hypothetical protein n=1 Tax=Fischerella sp. TaxID=1191 RepID=UPI00185EBD66|nr:hypothetical protein [Fischerella sp.]NWF62092.1 hypothetical protein [Fischerella sp.]